MPHVSQFGKHVMRGNKAEVLQLIKMWFSSSTGFVWF